MEKIILASNNKHKIIEFKNILNDKEILSLNEINYYDEIEENGNTFFENALIKAKTISEYLSRKGIYLPVIADDSGICVKSLNDEPEVYSARYSGVHGDSQANRNKMLTNLKDKENRDAYFCCTLVYYLPDGKYVTAEGKTYGVITTEEFGDTSFGYDCIFFSNELNKTFGEATSEEKNKVSHRAKAIINLKNKLNNN